MTLEASLVAWLKGDSSIANLIGERISPQPLPRGTTKPAITYLVVGEDLQTDLDGEDGDLAEVRVQIDQWARSQAEVRRLDKLVRTRLKASSFKATPIGGAALGDYEPATELHRFSRDYQCWHRPSAD